MPDTVQAEFIRVTYRRTPRKADIAVQSTEQPFNRTRRTWVKRDQQRRWSHNPTAGVTQTENGWRSIGHSQVSCRGAFLIF